MCVACVVGVWASWVWDSLEVEAGGRGGPGQLLAAGSLSSGVCGSLIIILAPDRGSCVVLGEADRQ